jgi:hypothetical protein
MIISLSGKKKAGKDTIANFLVEDKGFVKLSFATPLKELLVKVFKIDSSYLHDDKKKDEELDYYISIDYSHLDKMRDIIENEWGFPIDYLTREKMEKFYDTEIKTPRQLMQTVGTEIIRGCIRDDIFIQLLIETVKKISRPVVVADTRLSNERNALNEMGALMCLVRRGPEDTHKDKHISENDLGDESEYDVLIDNNIPLRQLRSEINLWYSIVYKK